MKIALISDIHGNLTALQNILPEVEQADRVICLGDVAAVGPQPHQTISFLRKVKWPCVLGNADEKLAKSEPESYEHIPEGERKKLMALDAWTESEVDDAERGFLSRFKPTMRIKVGKRTLFCYHGSPRSNVEQILSTTPEDKLAKILEGRDASVYSGGHTHSQMVRKYGSSLVINPGSVGLPFFRRVDGKVMNPSWAEYAILTSSGDDLVVELRRKIYSKRDLRNAVVKSGMPDPEWWLRDWI